MQSDNHTICISIFSWCSRNLSLSEMSLPLINFNITYYIMKEDNTEYCECQIARLNRKIKLLAGVVAENSAAITILEKQIKPLLVLPAEVNALKNPVDGQFQIVLPPPSESGFDQIRFVDMGFPNNGIVVSDNDRLLTLRDAGKYTLSYQINGIATIPPDAEGNVAVTVVPEINGDRLDNLRLRRVARNRPNAPRTMQLNFSFNGSVVARRGEFGEAPQVRLLINITRDSSTTTTFTLDENQANFINLVKYGDLPPTV